MNTPNPEQAHASIATTGSAQTLSQLGFTRHSDTETVIIQSVGGIVRFTVNGTTPTASLGLQIADGAMIQLSRNDIVAAKFITGSGAPKLEIASYVL